MTNYELIQKLAENKADGKVHITLVDGNKKISAEITNVMTIAWHGKDIEIVAEKE